MLAKAKQSFQKDLIAFALSISLVFSLFQCLPGLVSPHFGSELASNGALMDISVASISADPEPFPHHPPN